MVGHPEARKAALGGGDNTFACFVRGMNAPVASLPRWHICTAPSGYKRGSCKAGLQHNNAEQMMNPSRHFAFAKPRVTGF